jgi:ubiquinone/menaquinone biosynthesis C-methylase UbiE
MPLPDTLIRDLMCPYCGSSLGIGSQIRSSCDGLSEGTLQCDCYEYPVVEGIAVLRQMSPVSSARNEAVDRLKQGNSGGALQWLLENGNASGVPSSLRFRKNGFGLADTADRLRAFLQKINSPLFNQRLRFNKGFEDALRISRPQGYADYLYYRYANPSLLGAIPPLLVLGQICVTQPAKRVLDLLSGTGHTSGILRSHFPEIELVAADADFVNLLLLRQYVAPGTMAVCCDAEAPLPFRDSSIDGVFCLDGLHYVRSKAALLREVDRTVSEGGTWCFAHMHNRTGENSNPGVPLPASGYAERFTFGEHRLVPEHEVLRQFQVDGTLDLTMQTDIKSLHSSNALTLVGTRESALLKCYNRLEEIVWSRSDLLALNPIYRVERGTGGLTLRASWPSEALRRECVAEKVPVPPDRVELPASLLDEISRSRDIGSLPDGIRNLMRSFVLVSLPECYPAVRLSHPF